MLAALGFLPRAVTGWIWLRPLVVGVAPQKEVVANETKTPEHVQCVLAVSSQAVAPAVITVLVWALIRYADDRSQFFGALLHSVASI
jgi:hypothetical protein